MKKIAADVGVAIIGASAGVLATYLMAKKLMDSAANTGIGKTAGAVVNVLDTGANWITKYPAAIWAMFSQGMNGSFQHPEFQSAQFYLNIKYVTPDYKIDPVWRRSIEAAHVGIPPLFNRLLDDTGHIKPEYRHLINKIISKDVL